MTTTPLLEVEIYLNQWDVTANVNSVKPGVKRERLDKTTFGSPTVNGAKWKEWTNGLGSGEVAVSTFFDADLIDTAIRPLEATTGNLLSVAADDQFGSFAVFGSGTMGDVERGGDVGQMAKLDFPVMMSGRQGVLAGKQLVPKSTKTATGNGSGFQIGAVSSAQRVWAAAHVFSVAGTSTPTLALKLQSDDNAGFSSPTDRITFTNFTAVGAQLSSLAGAITDTYWRFVWTITGTSPQFSVAAFAAVQ